MKDHQILDELARLSSFEDSEIDQSILAFLRNRHARNYWARVELKKFMEDVKAGRPPNYQTMPKEKAK